jgi:hypothetical protein
MSVTESSATVHTNVLTAHRLEHIMRRAARLSTVVLGAAAALALSVPTALAQEAVVEPYSGVLSNTATQPTGASPGTGVSPGTGTAVSPSTVARTAPATLPFTGGELVLSAALGAGAVLGGAVLVAAGRRRTLA